jgi:hypothetical protein
MLKTEEWLIPNNHKKRQGETRGDKGTVLLSPKGDKRQGDGSLVP